LLFGFDQISREREQGTLKLILGNSVSRAKVLAGKWLGNFISLAVPFLLVTLLGVAVLQLAPGARFSAGQVARLGIILALAVLYIGFFLSLGMLISALTRRAATSVVVLLFIWALLVFVIPNLGTLLARQFVTVPPVRALSEKHQQAWTREVLLAIANGTDRKQGIEMVRRETEQMEEDFRLKFDRLVRTSRDINRISPAASFLDAASEIAGTGIGEERRLKGEILRYNDAVVGQILDNWDVAGQAPAFPAFSYKPRSLGDVFAGGALSDTAWLAVFNIIAFALAFVAFVRYDAR
jgi:ABC-type transport system involved in multi-copper enzyme maturation permease subunit